MYLGYSNKTLLPNKYKRKHYYSVIRCEKEKKDRGSNGKAEEEGLSINKFEKEDIKVNKNLNVNIFRSENEQEESAYDKGLCIYNILKDIEIKDVKKVPIFNENLTNVKVEKKEDTINLIQTNHKDKYLKNHLIYKDTNYKLPYMLNYYPDDMFIFNFDGVINLNKQEKIIVSFFTFLKIFNQSLTFNGKRVSNLALYDFMEKRKYLFESMEGSSMQREVVPNHLDSAPNHCCDTVKGEDPFILLKLMPKFMYTRLLYIYKYLKRNEDIVIAIKYIYEEINNICIKYNYDINEIIRMCEEKNTMAMKLNRLRDLEKTMQIPTDCGASDHTDVDTNVNTNVDVNVYEITKELTEGTFNPNVLYKYKHIENLANVFPSFRFDFEDFYTSNFYLKLYDRYKVNAEDVLTQFDIMRSLLMKKEKEAYTNLLKYRYVCNNLTDEEKKRHETFNLCCIDIINNNINVYKKPIYIISSVEDSSFIRYTLQSFGLNIVEPDDEHLLRIFGKDSLNVNHEQERTNTENSILSSLKKLVKSKYFSGGGKQKKRGRKNEDRVEKADDEAEDKAEDEAEDEADDKAEDEDVAVCQSTSVLLPDDNSENTDYLFDPYCPDIGYLNHVKKTQKRDYFFRKNPHYMNMLRQKCNLVNTIIEKYHDDNIIHILDHKYDDLNALNNDKRFNKKVRLYFCEWGYNTYEEKLKAIYNDKIKTFSQSFKLLFLCCTYQNSSRREHTHGKGIPMDFYAKYMHKYFLKNNLITYTDRYGNPVQPP
ncbi:conserved Plasmodium protein, unknown function [Plasmodium malariae]|uniref:Uncharacterized protein n=1 Tax=Plasmodium malariae TaxID=5858 RepID=A0A1D3JLK2_PLAMA|nr:conserved Plasmodium protein, unknown function [Plasmodium malariae]SBT87390.1 conserved Plasmodium protein, unknown function [Plasmodium malariae]